MDTDTLAGTLSRCPMFASLDRPELSALAGTCSDHSYGAGEIVCLRGDTRDCMYVVAVGSVAVSLSAEDGRDVLLAVLGPCDSFGELAIVDGGPRVATITARTRTTLVVVPRAPVAELLTRRPLVAAAVLQALAVMVRRLDEHACDLIVLDLPRRVEKYLARLVTPADAHIPRGRNDQSDGLVPVQLDLNQADLARQVGGSRQQVNRILMNLEEAGSIERLGHRIVSIRPNALYSGN
ncbi:MAG: family transcriptional regulator, cyclic receptor protein [Actinomycetota bacterium]|nr:family transcriptional regulator, cyclic receptor protein [Actinomycetota bacterium]